MPDDAQRFLTVREVAQRLGAHEVTVHRWLRSGRLRGSRLGGTRLGWRITEGDLDDFIQRGAGSAPAIRTLHCPTCGQRTPVTEQTDAPDGITIHCARGHAWQLHELDRQAAPAS